MESKIIFIISTTLICIVDSSRKLVDMSHQYNDNKTLYYPIFEDIKFKIIHRGWTKFVDVDAWFELNEFTMAEHLGTHMDAPSHLADGPGYWRLHQIPVDRFIGEAVVIDITYKTDNNPDALVEVRDLVMWEEKYGMIKDGSIVLVYTGWDKYWGDEAKYMGNDQKDTLNFHWPGVGVEAAQWLVNNRKISGLGIDTLCFDPGNLLTYPVHRILLPENIYGLENVKNIGKLPKAGARVYVMPINMHGGSGGPTRIVGEFGMGQDVMPPWSGGNHVCVSVKVILFVLFMAIFM